MNFYLGFYFFISLYNIPSSNFSSLFLLNQVILIRYSTIHFTFLMPLGAEVWRRYEWNPLDRKKNAYLQPRIPLHVATNFIIRLILFHRLHVQWHRWSRLGRHFCYVRSICDISTCTGYTTWLYLFPVYTKMYCCWSNKMTMTMTMIRKPNFRLKFVFSTLTPEMTLF